jgi:Holliday junction DNA helicase RuvA
VVVDVQGVGYELFVPLSTFAALPDLGKTVALHVHTAVREDAIQLYGFASGLERRVFELLLRASRVGPRMAQGILSGISASALLEAIQVGDVHRLKRVPGVGLKTAERIVVELRDRAAEVAAGERAGAFPPSAAAPSQLASARDEALSALVNLGYPRPHAEQVVDDALADAGRESESPDLAALIRAALRRLAT